MTRNSSSAFCAALLLLVGSLSAVEKVGEPLTEHEQEERRQRINQLSIDADLKQLGKNFSQYRSLTEDQRAKFRRMYVEIESDAQRQELNRLLDNYYEWLEGLSSHERQAIRGETDIAARIRRIQELRKRDSENVEQVARETSEEILHPPSSDKPAVPETNPPLADASPRQRGEKMNLASTKILELLERRMLEVGAVNSEEASSLQQLSSWERHRRLVLEYLPRHRPRGKPRIFDDATREEMSRIIDDTVAPGWSRPERIPQVVAVGMLSELKQEYEAASSDSPRRQEFIDRIKTDLRPEELERFEDKSSSEWPAFIVRVYSERIFKAFARNGEFRLPPPEMMTPNGKGRLPMRREPRHPPGDHPEPPPHDRPPPPDE